jgi:hypothetical protein
MHLDELWHIGSDEVGLLPVVGHTPPGDAVQVTFFVLWQEPVGIQAPPTDKVAAVTVYDLPVVSKLPLSVIPQFGPIIWALPVGSMPTIDDVGKPRVYIQDVFVPPLMFVATARATTAWLPTPKTFMKYVG